jgi:hypothetical protein
VIFDQDEAHRHSVIPVGASRELPQTGSNSRKKRRVKG